MSNIVQKLQLSPIRPMQEFAGGNQWAKPTLNPKEFGELQKQVVANLIYYQSNYGVILIPFFFLIAFCNLTAILFGLAVVAGLVAAFVYGTREKPAVTAPLQDRPILVLILVLVVAYFVISMLGTVSIFLTGIALPLALIVGHATAHKPALQNTAESLSSQTSPMGLLLGWLGTKPAEEPAKPKAKGK